MADFTQDFQSCTITMHILLTTAFANGLEIVCTNIQYAPEHFISIKRAEDMY